MIGFSFDEKIGSYPADWSLEKLKDSGEFISGSTPSSTNENYWNGDITWLVPSDLTALSDSTNYVYDSESKITLDGFKSRSTNMLPIGSLCLSSRATIGEAVISGVELCTNQGFINIVCNEKHHALYLLYWVKNNKNYISRYAAGTTFLEIGRRTFKNLKIALPKEINEQKAIAGILSKVDEAIEAVENSIKAADRLKKSLMQNLLTGKLTPDGRWRSEDEFKATTIGILPMDWQVRTVKEISIQVTDGEHTTPVRTEKGFFLLSARNIKNGSLDLSNVDYVSELELRRIQQRCNPQSGDILISCSGTIGNVCIVPQGLDAGMVRSVALIKLNKDVIESDFLELVLQSYSLQNQIKVSVASSVQGNIFQGAVKKLRIPYPPLKIERTEISEKIRLFQDQVIAKLAKIQSLQRLKKSLMQNLFTGKVRVDVEKINKLLEEG